MDLGRSNGFEKKHAQHVTMLALRLFDELQPLHRMGGTEKQWLFTAAMLHDIGKSRNPELHHKLAREIIVSSGGLPFQKKQRKMIALIARYHRSILPDVSHKHFGRLDPVLQDCVSKLAALLRLADGLDKYHKGLVRNVCCDIRRKAVRFIVESRDSVELDKAMRKADLFEAAFGRKVKLRLEIVTRVINIGLGQSRRAACVA
jgi:exopolyphosphatase/guanosine-5'-triphosphate,3'-diphosphate pyrophosphatase